MDGDFCGSDRYNLSKIIKAKRLGDQSILPTRFLSNTLIDLRKRMVKNGINRASIDS